MYFSYQNLDYITLSQRHGSNKLGDRRAKSIESLHHKLMGGDSVAISIVMLYSAHHCHQSEVIATDRNRVAV